MTLLTPFLQRHPWGASLLVALTTAACMTAPNWSTPSPSSKAAYDLSDSFKVAIERTSPSVVHIVSQLSSRRSLGAEGQGSGVIIREEGVIVTNNHVIEGAQRLRVMLHDGRVYEAEVLGRDPDSDLAVIKIEADGLRAAPFGDSDAVEVGDWVLAMGNPFGLSHSVTAGIVSAMGRANVGVATFEEFIQTDCAINPGNSGGPLVDLEGRVIGINSAIASRNGGYQGIAFSIPSRMARSVIDGLIAEGRVERGWLGVLPQDLDPLRARDLGLESRTAVILDEVYERTPAAVAGLKPGDIVLRLDGRPVESSNAFINAVTQNRPGDEVLLDVLRAGERQEIPVVLGQRELGLAEAQNERRLGISGDDDLRRRGMAVTDMAPLLARRLGFDDGAVVVTGVDANSPAYRKGIRSGMIILRAGNRDIQSARQFANALDAVDEESSIILRVREGQVVRDLVIDP